MKKPFLQLNFENEALRMAGSVFGALLYAVGVNFFIVPADLYTGGVMGFCQIIRTLLVDYLHLNFGGMDIAGILYYIVNLPLLLLAWRRIDHKFVLKTILTVTAITVFLSVIPVVDIMQGDRLTKCLIGGITTGLGAGIVLWTGATSGGMDILGIMMMKRGSHVSVGRVNLSANVILYAVCALLFNLTTAIYSIIYTFLLAFTVDKLHMQNINVEVTVITKVDSREMEQEILTRLYRGVTKLAGTGEYTEEPVNVLYILTSKYEIARLRSIIHKYDPKAFIVAKNDAVVYGNYLKKF